MSKYNILKAPYSPLMRAFGDAEYWIVSEEMVWLIGNTSDKIVVPKGFVTDFASIPQPLWSFGLSPQGEYSRAAVIHDFLYWSQVCTREQADNLLLIAMKESNVGLFDETAIYQGVRNLGEASWRHNKKEREAGLPRVVPDKYLKPSDPNILWNAYRKILVADGIQDPPFTENGFCKYGDSSHVP
jgi:hypothetical protein